VFYIILFFILRLYCLYYVYVFYLSFIRAPRVFNLFYLTFLMIPQISYYTRMYLNLSNYYFRMTEHLAFINRRIQPDPCKRWHAIRMHRIF